LVARKNIELENIAAEIRVINPSIAILTYSSGISEKEVVKALFAKNKLDFGTVDVLVSNAGSGKSALPIKDVDPKYFRADFGVNVEGTMLMTQEFLRLVGTSKPATIINITSSAAVSVISATSSYSLGKPVQIQTQRFVAAESPNVS
jgi:NAD(P)-dependent dehydrogenase (short-subunit alcohol dehydrogenase family)